MRLDPAAKTAIGGMAAFLAPPDGAPVYHGFPVLHESLTDGWLFGTITEIDDPEGCDSGDAFVVAPDGSRAGFAWSVDEYPIKRICEPDERRWGVYAIAFPKVIRNTSDFVECCRAVLPELQAIHAALRAK